jgi:crossover junction endodeoxyribonuclease RusA
MLELELPFPPSVNSCWRAVRGRTILSARGREYRAKAIRACRDAEVVDGPVSVKIYLYPPDRRRRDVDNYAKAILDALVHARVLRDDSLIDRLVLVRMPPEAGGRAVVRIYGGSFTERVCRTR